VERGFDTFTVHVGRCTHCVIIRAHTHIQRMSSSRQSVDPLEAVVCLTDQKLRKRDLVEAIGSSDDDDEGEPGHRMQGSVLFAPTESLAGKFFDISRHTTTSLPLRYTPICVTAHGVLVIDSASADISLANYDMVTRTAVPIAGAPATFSVNEPPPWDVLDEQYVAVVTFPGDVIIEIDMKISCVINATPTGREYCISLIAYTNLWVCAYTPGNAEIICVPTKQMSKIIQKNTHWEMYVYSTPELKYVSCMRRVTPTQTISVSTLAGEFQFNPCVHPSLRVLLPTQFSKLLPNPISADVENMARVTQLHQLKWMTSNNLDWHTTVSVPPEVDMLRAAGYIDANTIDTHCSATGMRIMSDTERVYIVDFAKENIVTCNVPDVVALYLTENYAYMVNSMACITRHHHKTNTTTSIILDDVLKLFITVMKHNMSPSLFSQVGNKVYYHFYGHEIACFLDEDPVGFTPSLAAV
jgi:hypothetical protein